jgi:ADP-heptose:LPS heptosyltransferase
MKTSLILNSFKNSYLLRIAANIARLFVDTAIGFVSLFSTKNVKDISQKKRLLLIKTGEIGDFIIFSGILEYIRSLYAEEEWEITLLAASGSELLANFLKKDVLGLGILFDSFIPVNQKSFSWNLLYRYKKQLDLIQTKYDLVISPTFPRFRDESQILFISKSEQKIGVGIDDTSLDLKIERNDRQPNTELFESFPGLLTEIDRNAHFIKMLGYDGEINAVPRWKIPEHDRNTARQTLKDLGLVNQIAVICPGAGAKHREWPAAKMAEAIDYLWDKYSILSIICGSPAEKYISEEIQSYLKSTKAICLCGKTNLVELGAIISISRLCISMDSGPAHLAIAVNSPLVCIVGGGHYKRFFPYGNPEIFRCATEELDCFYCNWICKFERPICVENISVETVTREIDLLIDSTSQLSDRSLNHK